MTRFYPNLLRCSYSTFPDVAFSAVMMSITIFSAFRGSLHFLIFRRFYAEFPVWSFWPHRTGRFSLRGEKFVGVYWNLSRRGGRCVVLPPLSALETDSQIFSLRVEESTCGPPVDH
jgi:hypothetical protein